jgi:Flp pilus assembly protein TadB
MLENKLLNFRNQQEKKEEEEKGTYFKSIFNLFSSSSPLELKKRKENKIIKTKSDIKREKYEQLQKVLKEQTEATSLINNKEEEEEEEEVYYSKHFIIILFLKFILWLILFVIFIKLEFGLVYFIISLILVIYLNTSKNKKKGVLSAYSVFNPNLERLNGTFTSDHVEKSIRNTF